jgi:hypothetical protein
MVKTIQSPKFYLLVFSLLLAFVVNVQAQNVTLTLCEKVDTPNDMEGVGTAVNPTKSFTFVSGGPDNVHMLLTFEPFGKSVGLRVIVTEKDKDGDFVQDRVLSMSSTAVWATTSMPVSEKGKYCVRVVDEFDETIVYSKEQYFNVK